MNTKHSKAGRTAPMVFRSRTNLAGPSSMSTMKVLASTSLVMAWSIGALLFGVHLYISPEPYSVSSPLQDIKQVVARLDQDSFMQRLSIAEKSKLAGKVQFVSSVIAKSAGRIEGHNELALTIVSESLKANVDPLLVAAIVKSESRFLQNAISHKGARGLMQLMPDTAHYTANKLLKPILRAQLNATLHQREYNLSLGITYLKHLEDIFNGNRELALIAYNWGPGNLKAALKNKSHIPESTRAYARKILRNHEKWNEELHFETTLAAKVDTKKGLA